MPRKVIVALAVLVAGGSAIWWASWYVDELPRYEKRHAALRHLRQSGASFTCNYYRGSVLFNATEDHVGMRDSVTVHLDSRWHGTDDDLRKLLEVHGLHAVAIKKGAILSEDLLRELRARLPHTHFFDERSPAAAP